MDDASKNTISKYFELHVNILIAFVMQIFDPADCGGQSFSLICNLSSIWMTAMWWIQKEEKLIFKKGKWQQSMSSMSDVYWVCVCMFEHSNSDILNSCFNYKPTVVKSITHVFIKEGYLNAPLTWKWLQNNKIHAHCTLYSSHSFESKPFF